MTTKISLLLAAATVLLVAAVTRVRAVFNKCVPVGYEDAGGFHPGDEPEC